MCRRKFTAHLQLVDLRRQGAEFRSLASWPYQQRWSQLRRPPGTSAGPRPRHHPRPYPRCWLAEGSARHCSSCTRPVNLSGRGSDVAGGDGRSLSAALGGRAWSPCRSRRWHQWRRPFGGSGSAFGDARCDDDGGGEGGVDDRLQQNSVAAYAVHDERKQILWWPWRSWA